MARVQEYLSVWPSDLGADGARDHVAGREFAAGHVGKETLTLFVDQRGACPAQRLCGERHWVRPSCDSGWVELHEFKIAQERASPSGQREATPDRAQRVCRACVEPTHAACGKHNRPPGEEDGALILPAEFAAD